jgi:hypothetical protein
MATRGFGPAGENGWAFGQVIAIVVLAAPLLSVIEYLSGSTPTAAQGCELEVLGTIADEGAATALPPGEHSDEIEYERSPSFCGILFLAAWFWVACAIFLYTDAPTEFHVLVLALLFEVVLFQPTLQIMWSLFCIWLEKHNPHNGTASGLRLLVFLALLEASIFEFFTSEPDEFNIVDPAILTSSLVVLYMISLVWSFLELQARVEDEALGYPAEANTLYRCFTQLLVTFPVTIGSATAVYAFEFPNPEHAWEAWALLAITVSSQTVWMGVEVWLSRYNQTKTPRQLRVAAVRVIVFLAAWVSLVVWFRDWWSYALRVWPPGHFFVTVLGFSILSLGWCITTAVRWRALADAVRIGVFWWLLW